MKYYFLSLACSLKSSMKDAQEWLRKPLTTQLKEIGNAESLGVSLLKAIIRIIFLK